MFRDDLADKITHVDRTDEALADPRLPTIAADREIRSVAPDMEPVDSVYTEVRSAGRPIARSKQLE